MLFSEEISGLLTMKDFVLFWTSWTSRASFPFGLAQPPLFIEDAVPPWWTCQISLHVGIRTSLSDPVSRNRYFRVVHFLTVVDSLKAQLANSSYLFFSFLLVFRSCANAPYPSGGWRKEFLFPQCMRGCGARIFLRRK